MQQLKQEVHQYKERYDKFVSSEKERTAKESEKLIVEYQKQLETLNNKVNRICYCCFFIFCTFSENFILFFEDPGSEQ